MTYPNIPPSVVTSYEDASYSELFWPIVPKGDVDGSFDWFSGVMTLDVDHEVWKELDSAPGDVRERISRVYGHEMFHFMQFVTMGFMYDWACRLFALIRTPVQRVQKQFPARDFSGIKALIAKGPANLTDAERADIGRHFRLLDAPGRSGLTTRAIIEGQAYFAERILNYKIEASHKWTPHLHDAPQSIYRLAFDHLAFAAGFHSAYDWFSFVCSISLCTDDPVLTFERLALALAPDKIAREQARTRFNSQEMVAFVADRLPDLRWRTAVEKSAQRHPVFTDSAHELGRLQQGGVLDLIELFARPDVELQRMFALMRIELPIMFKPTHPTKLAAQRPSRMADATLYTLFVMGSVGRQLTIVEASASEAEGAASLATIAWLERDHDQISLQLDADDARSGDASRMMECFEPTTDSQAKCKLWGRLVLKVPAALNPDPDALVPNVPEARRLMQQLYRALPMFPLYLALPFGPVEWFGSLLTASSERAQAVEVLPLIAEAERAIESCGRAIGQNPWLAVRCLLDPIRESATRALH